MLDICCNNLSAKFSELFSSYLRECSKVIYTRGGYWDDFYDDMNGDWWDNGYWYDEMPSSSVKVINKKHYQSDDDEYYPSYKQKSFKKNKRVRGKKHKGVTIYDSDAIESVSSSSKNESDITIHYYDDIMNPSSKRTFNSLYDFEEFLDSENIYVSSTDQASLLRNNVSHCCKDPNFKSLDTPWLITDPTYGGLRWLCAANDDEMYYE
jgi:hypothetical protein